jgi:acetate kinase
MSDVILTLNAGSSSLKFSAFPVDRPDDPPRFQGKVDGIGAGPKLLFLGETDERSLPPDADHEQALAAALEGCQRRLAGQRVVAVGHRVVHGGDQFAASVAIDDAVLEALEKLVPLAPLHQPHHLAAIRAMRTRSAGVPQVACFDTAFHQTQSPIARMFGLPRALTEQGVKRYGFHGLSYEYIASQLPRIDPAAANGRCVVAHLGNGASMCAMRGGKSVATTMGFTPADGLMMGTRSGSLDPGVLIHLSRQGMTADELEHVVNHESGLLGVSGISSDMRTLLEANEPRAREAVELFIDRASRELGSLTAALGGLDAFVFTGGMGENAPAIRERLCEKARWLGVDIDPDANREGQTRISQPASRVAVYVVPTDEERLIAGHTRQVLGLPGNNRPG